MSEIKRYELPGFEFLEIKGVVLSNCQGKYERLKNFQTTTIPLNGKEKSISLYGKHQIEAKENMKKYLKEQLESEKLKYLKQATNMEIGKKSRDLIIKARDLSKVNLALEKGGLEKMAENYHALMNKNEGGNK